MQLTESDNIDKVFKLDEYVNGDNHDNINDTTLEIEQDATKESTIDADSGYDDSLIEIENPQDSVEANEASDIYLVEYNHEEKPRKLGRPRNHGLSSIKSSPSDATDNEDKSKYMLYRLDDKPVEGPGSRGGKGKARNQKGKVTPDTIKKRKLKQSQLVFGKQGIQLKEEIENGDGLKVEDDKTDSKEKKEDKKQVKQTKKVVKKQESEIPASKTTILNGRHKVTRQFPGPVIGLYYDLYDENLMNDNKHKDATKEKLAFGFEVSPSPHAEDIIFLVSYASLFRDVLDIGRICPQDIEDGIGLDDPLQKVSPLMNRFFSRLVTLVLNRKVDINPRNPGKPISELRSLCVTLGLPKEWKDQTEVYTKYNLGEQEVVDPNNPKVFLTEGFEYHAPYVVENPFTDKQGFEKLGFPGISDPSDRLIMLRLLCQWSLSASTDIRKAFNEMLQKQDLPGDKETFYASRALLKGFKHTKDLTVQTNKKISKNKYNEDSDMVSRYVEPVADPMSHGLRARLNDMVVGDVGFNIGRFYMVRVADTSDGGLGSVDNMKQTWENLSLFKASNPTRFKLYVQDVYKFLVENLDQEGLEFVNGEEVKHKEKNEAKSYYYEVASNSEQLAAFVDYLSVRLGIKEGDLSIISPSSILFNPTQALYEYLLGILPLLTQQENLMLTSRSSRKRVVDYTEQNANKKVKEYFEDEVYEEPEDEADEDFKDEEIIVQDDDDDDDYMEL